MSIPFTAHIICNRNSEGNYDDFCIMMLTTAKFLGCIYWGLLHFHCHMDVPKKFENHKDLTKFMISLVASAPGAQFTRTATELVDT